MGIRERVGRWIGGDALAPPPPPPTPEPEVIERYVTGMAVSTGGSAGNYYDGNKTPGGVGEIGGLYGFADTTHKIIDAWQLRAHSQRAYRRNAIANNIINTAITTVIGAGLRLEAMPALDVVRSIIGGTPGNPVTDQHKWTQQVEHLFGIWAQSPAASYTRRLTFYDMQRLAYRQLLLDGKCLAVLRSTAPSNMQMRRGRVSPLHVQLIPADRLAWDLGTQDAARLTRGRVRSVFDGAALNERGETIGYFVYDNDAYDSTESLSRQQRAKYLPRYGANGEPIVLEMLMPNYPADIKGLPLLTPILQDIEALEKYRVFEVDAAKTNSKIAMQVTNPHTAGVAPNFGGRKTTIPTDNQGGQQVRIDSPLPSMMVVHGYPGQELHGFDTKRPNVNYAAFTDAVLKQVSATCGMPIEILHKHFSSSYSASRAALVELWRWVDTQRAILNQSFCAPVYRTWLGQELMLGRIDARGWYFADDYGRETVRAAWAQSGWAGAPKGMIDPAKEVKAATVAQQNGYLTAEQIARNNYNKDWFANMEHAKKEQEVREQVGLQGTGVGGMMDNKDGNKDKEQMGGKGNGEKNR